MYSLTDMAREAGTAALNDAGISYQDVEAVVASYCYGEPTSGVIIILLKNATLVGHNFLFQGSLKHYLCQSQCHANITFHKILQEYLIISPLHPKINMPILNSILYTFSKMLTKKVCLTINSFFGW